MDSLLFQVVSALCAIFIVIATLKPQSLPFLLDKDTDKPSLGRIGQFTALVVSTWAMVELVLDDKLTEWFFTGYMLTWAGAQAASLALKIRGQAGTTETSTAQTRTVT